MKPSGAKSIFFGALVSNALGALLPAKTERVVQTDPQCIHGPDTRGCWTEGYSIADDFDQRFPTTGNILSYNLELTNGTCNPDGHGDRLCLLINGQYPGPTVRASWGDTVQVTVKNSMQDNGTSLHFHGVRQYYSNNNDGVSGVTECPLAPGDTKTYTFQATQHGTSWYHSHFSAQYGEGTIGPIVFDGPASASYDVDLGPYPLTDLYYMNNFQVNAIALQNLQTPTSPAATPPIADNILINGTNMDANGAGGFNHVVVEGGKRYRLRLINMSVNQVFQVSLDSHFMQVITSDFVPIQPYYAQSLVMNVGQRYDVVIHADQIAGNYWFRVTTVSGCLSGNKGRGLAVWTYEGAQISNPTSIGWGEQVECIEPSSFVPYWSQPVPSSSFADSVQELDVSITKQVITPGGDAIFVWALGNTSLNLDLSSPTLSYLMSGNTAFPDTYRVIPTMSEGGWNYWIIQQGSTAAPIQHPVHLHGHDFFILGQGSGRFDAAIAGLNWVTPVRRDTATLPANGWLALAFNSNNPGIWLMHCHVAFHMSEGFAVQFLESPSQITIQDEWAYQQTCENWKGYASNAYWKQDDSGV